MVNTVILVGNVGKDPEVRYAQSGTAIANFSVATSEKYKGETQTEWHRVVAFGKLAEICGEYLKKSSKVFVEGKIQTRQWEDQSGNKRYSTEIIAKEMKMLDSKGESAKRPVPF